MKLEASAIPTRILHVGEPLNEFVLEHLRPHSIQDGDVVVVTSKIASLAERRTVPLDSISKEALVKRESDVFIGPAAYGTFLTVKDGLFIPSAGIDESNAEGPFYILYPEDSYKTAAELGRYLRSQLGIKKLGIILSDSHTQPLRRGVTGIGLSHWGFKATRTLIGEPDLFGRKLKMTHVNVLDSLSVAAVYAMGEAAESRPIAVVRADGVEFTDETSVDEIRIPIEEDIYFPVLGNRT